MSVEARSPIKFKAFIALAMVCFFWGTTWIASKEGVLHMPALQLAGIRQSFGGILYVMFFLIRGYKLPRGNEWWPILVLSILNFVLTNGLTTLGLKFINAGLGAIISAIFPLWIVVIGLFRNGTLPPSKAVAGLVLGFAGICVIFYEHLENLLHAEFRLGILLSLIASWTWAFGTLYTKNQATKFNPYFSIGLQMLLSGVIMSGLAAAGGTGIPLATIPWQAWAAVFYLVVFGSVISFVAYLYALQHLPTAQASVYAYMNPVVAVISGYFFYGDPLTPALALGGAIIIYGVYLINQVYRKTPAT